MIPYSNLLFFYLAFLLLIPAFLLGIFEKPIKKYGLIATIIMLFLFVGSSKLEMICLICFYLGQVILLKFYLYIRRFSKNIWHLRIILFLSLLPLILVKCNRFITVKTLGFIGISYVTFRTIEILIEIYDGLIKEISLIDYTYFILFFPTILSGPIDRFRRFKSNIDEKISRKTYIEDYFAVGLKKVLLGALYKFVIATFISNLWMNKIPRVHTCSNILNYMYSYSLYLFFDFAGYSLMAIGIGYILGVKVPENFNRPFISKDIKEFWNRWHMSLSFWFRDFIYTRFVMDSMRKNRFKNRYTASYIGFFITMLVMGIWHGVYIHYLIYGVYEGILLAGTDYFQKNSKFYKRNKKKKWYKYVSVFVTFNLVCFGLLIFSGYLYNK
ncbi:D-alanyl-lipoteichoic acid biosynthesis protein DltB [Clostridium niameyense]|uniref:Teichoic acid D-alanyltransferase n=1 Tax=Clostridium niameyense TaxID=1622073 RepID=A0A6M0RCL2_9CLOT|nr:D-alanyl-lipoteichoic acid biosynthesis protein DltB [Clostridium niameyense]NEZ47912.1 D-alanyl-lipoteichoic acid biosynthesis protein DltB [Clostridium niameyense]